VGGSALALGIAVLVGSGESITAPRILRWNLTEYQQGLATEIGVGLIMLAVFDVAIARWLQTREELDQWYVELMEAKLQGALALGGLTVAERRLVSQRLGDLGLVSWKNDQAIDAAQEYVIALRSQESVALSQDRMSAMQSREYTIKGRVDGSLEHIKNSFELDPAEGAALFFFGFSLHTNLDIMPWDVEAQLADFARLTKSGELRL
jgi:hypothetical protein